MARLLVSFVFYYVILHSSSNAQDSASCSSQSDCSSQESCLKQRCVNPCDIICGSNTVCSVRNHRADCRCKQGYDGDPLAGCRETCGIVNKLPAINPSVKPLIRHGSTTELGDFPWLAAIFLKNGKGRWTQQCGGTLISSHLVVTAAHCLRSNEGNVVKPQDILVGLGKYYRDYYKEENYSVIASVRELVFPRNYNGDASSYALDIGLLDLAVSVRPSAYIMPACVDWTASVPTRSGDEGYITGWGTTENGTTSDTVLSARLSYMDNSDCIVRLQLKFKRFLTHDKFCAGGQEGEQPDKGDSGGGLTFLKDGKQHLIGIVSTKIIGETSFSLFTDLQNIEHISWLKQQAVAFNQLKINRVEVTYQAVNLKQNHDPCDNLCGSNTVCTVNQLTPACACKEGYSGDPFSGCKPQAGCWPPPGKKNFLVFTDSKINWLDAFQRCRNNGMRLARVESDEDVRLLQTTMKVKEGLGDNGIWTAGSDMDCEGDWRWETTGQPIDMTHVAVFDGKLNNANNNEHCLEVWHSPAGDFLLWNDINCALGRWFVCEYYT